MAPSKDGNPKTKSRANIKAMSIPDEAHAKLTAQANASHRHIYEQAKFCLLIGIEVVEGGGGMDPLIIKTIKEQLASKEARGIMRDVVLKELRKELVKLKKELLKELPHRSQSRRNVDMLHGSTISENWRHAQSEKQQTG